MRGRRRYYWDLYRDVADAAGVPRNVWNMHARGGASEAQQAGVALQDIAEHAQHADNQHDAEALHHPVSGAGWLSSVSRIGRRKWTKGENGVPHRI